jgi:DNA-binding transcriptional ArsR family regulator
MVTDDVFAVIAEATRRDILVSLRKGDKAVGELVEELAASQPTISKHLKVLREADLVSMRAQGQKRYYALNPKPLAGIATWLETFDVGPAAAAAKSPEADTHQAAEASQPSRGRPQTAPRQQGPASVASAAEVPESFAAADSGGAPGTAAADAATHAPGRPASGQLSPAVVVPGGTVPASAQDDTVPQQIGRTVGRGAKKAADLLANLPKFGRKK